MMLPILAAFEPLSLSGVVFILCVLALIGAAMQKWGPAPLILLCIAVILALFR
jgi:hypothetical protein